MKQRLADLPVLMRKASIIGVLIGILGVNLVPLTQKLEETIGLHLLFKMRGVRAAPPEVVIVSIDKASSTHLGLHEEPRKWPRTLHARLVETLSRQGTALIAFDVLFDEARSPEDDRAFAHAMKAAGNVVLCECLKKETIPVPEPARGQGGHLHIVRLVPPISVLAESAAALAPFPLPKVPVKVSQYWRFKTDAGDTPTLPVAALEIFSREVHDDFVRLLKHCVPPQRKHPQEDPPPGSAKRDVIQSIRSTRAAFEIDPSIGDRMLAALRALAEDPAERVKIPAIRALIGMYQGDSSRYLDFYGPPGTISTISYYRALQQPEAADAGATTTPFQGKALFVGLSELMQPDQKDGFYTVFSQESGVDISGVEIAATAFANLLEDRAVRPLGFRAHLFAVFLWGFLVGAVCLMLPISIAGLSGVGLGVIYLAAAHCQFKSTGVWLPLVIPLFVQLPLSLFAALTWKFVHASRERRNIREAFGYYLPDAVVDRLAKNIQDIQDGSRLVYGTCLSTDAEKYAALSETMHPETLGRFMNRYYEVIFGPVRRHGGIVSDVVGDAMMAIWASGRPDADLRRRACLTALDIATAVEGFNRSSGGPPLRTRLGLHFGRMMLGSVGAIDHYEYRAVGDVVNSASRLEGLNKHLGTQIIVSADVLHQLDGFLARPLGKFLLAGKSNPLEVHELICRLEESSEQQRSICAIFGEALTAFTERSWAEAADILTLAAQISPHDGPVRYYLRLCRHCMKSPPEEPWDGSIRLEKK